MERDNIVDVSAQGRRPVSVRSSQATSTMRIQQEGITEYIKGRQTVKYVLCRQREESLTTYTFGSGVAKHYFCRVCGIKSFYVPRSNPNGIDINLRCLTPQPKTVKIVNFDGQHWEQHAHTIAHKSM